MAGGLLVIGDAVTDVVALHRVPVATGTDTPADIAVRPGGSGANTASWAAHLGADARILTRVGYDTGQWHISELRAAGVRPHVSVDPAHPTAVVIAMVDASGERSMLTNRGAGGRIGPADWEDDLLEGVGRLHVSGYTLFARPGLELVRRALRAARGRGVPVSVDPASTGPLRAFGVGRFLDETAAATLVIPNRDEALLLAGEPRKPQVSERAGDSGEPAEPGKPVEPEEWEESGLEAAAAVLSARYGMAAVKLGASGALLAVAGRIVHRAAAIGPTATGAAGRAEASVAGTASIAGAASIAGTAGVVDSTGAGDAFAAGFLTALLSGEPPESALEAGCRAGAAAVTRLGGRPPARSSVPALTPDPTGRWNDDRK
ncbi:carbohydrate kinase family protein [Sphaerisporangium dianthi]|uniref:Carbohydrate kinase family protein n=1 Tax=Sphaerisporangium dianthi TaxID=1436120 RepID=A0ABV9CVQ0_9ACTN